MRNLPLQVWRLTLAYALMMAGTSLMVLIAGIIGIQFAPSPAYATLPVALTIVGVASSTLPTGKLLYRFGRRRVFVAYGLLAVMAALLAASSLYLRSFSLFCVAALSLGWSAAAGHQYRFAAMESVPLELAPKATSVLLLGGILAAAIGPEIAVRGQNLLTIEFAGSYLLLAGVYLVGIFIVSFYRESGGANDPHSMQGRPLKQIMRSPLIILAIAASAVGYGVMSFVMTSAPISMHEHAGHGMQATKWVLQSHILAMYLPSLVYPWLFSKLGFKGMMWSGVAAYIACLLIGSINTEFIHYWLTMVILGVGWNFLFLSGTNLLRYGYSNEERFKVQSFNDFLVFSIQGLASLSSGWFLFHWGWQSVISASLPLVLVFILLAAFTRIPGSITGRTG
ncbi:MAG: MFS transporter [Gammaproteobacteria bacterium]|nr:MFS transporter [Gammaproteobacteria bacterium]NNK97869.1 MFS transporter [Xanthomonadales bacterium]